MQGFEAPLFNISVPKNASSVILDVGPVHSGSSLMAEGANKSRNRVVNHPLHRTLVLSSK